VLGADSELLKEDMSKAQYLKCPFCEEVCIDARPGEVRCPMCHSEFEMDDRLECIFVDPKKIKLPAKGIVCSLCGLIQEENVKNCPYCGMWININVH
jgi:hypothetical protein